MIPILFSSFHPNEPENHMNLVPNHGGWTWRYSISFFSSNHCYVVDSDWDSVRKSSHSFKLGENMTFISLTAAPDCREPLTFDLCSLVDIFQSHFSATKLYLVVIVGIVLYLPVLGDVADKWIISDKTIRS